MPIDPDSILDSRKPPSAEDMKTSDGLEKRIDAYLRINFCEGQASTYYLPMTSEGVILELCRRYRDCGWNVMVLGTGECFDFAAMVFTRKESEELQAPVKREDDKLM